jgi:hypothetical protein
MRSLGELRCQVIACTVSDIPRFKRYFNPPPEANLTEELHIHLLQLWEHDLPNATGNQYNGMAVIAAGILTFGNLSMVDYILANLPPHRIVLDHGCGFCNLLAFRAVARLLPLPKELSNYSLWVKGSSEAKQVKNWVHEYRSHLIWNPKNEQFIVNE